MDEMWWFIVGFVIGGLALWLLMRERVSRLEAELAARDTEPAATPPEPARAADSD